MAGPQNLQGGELSRTFFKKVKGDFFVFLNFMYDIQHCFICRPSDSTVPEDAGIEPRIVATTALVAYLVAVRRSNHSCMVY
jgi:hypothetical protein